MATSDAPLNVPNVTLAVARSSQSGRSAPGVSGVISEGGTITISSDEINNFGQNAPIVEFFEDYNDGSAGASADAATPVVGSYAGTAPGPITDAHSHSGTKCMTSVKDDLNYRSQIALPNLPKSVLVSYWIFVPSGKAMPGYNVDSFTIRDGVSGSSWKLGWISGSDDAGGDAYSNADGPDLCLPTNNGEDFWSIAGNETGAGMYQKAGYAAPSTFFTYGEWCWVGILLDPENTNLLKIRHLSKAKGFYEYSEAIPEGFWGAYTDREYWKFFNIHGYVRTGDARTDVELYTDDILIQRGAGAGVTVMIGDAPELSNCTDIHVCKINSHSSAAIEADIRQTPFDSLAGKYLFVTDEQWEPITYDGAVSREIQ